jgi:hypothetical protein
LAALTKPFETLHKPALIASQKIAGSTTIYKGALVAANASGFAIPIDHGTANLTFLGIAEETVANTGADGDKSVRIAKFGGGVYVDLSSVTQSSVGKEVYAKTDNEVQINTAGLTNAYKVGTIVALETASTGVAGVRLRIDRYTN